MNRSRRSRLEKISWALYENEVSDFTMGPHQIMEQKEHMVKALEFTNITYYHYYYNSCLGMRAQPTYPQIDSSERLAAIAPSSQEYMEPQNPAGPEAWVALYPDSSQVWVNGAFTHFTESGFYKAKEFLRRGLGSISSREHQERLNLWKALMIFEAEFGSREALIATFEEALQFNNKRELTLQVLRWLMDNGKTEELEIIKNVIFKKFNTCRDVYYMLFEYYIKQGAELEARNLLEMSLQCVPQKHHSKMLTKFAYLEHKFTPLI